MTQARPSDYWFSSSAIYISLNALGDPNYLHANCASGSMILCYMRGINGLEYDSGHNYRRWPLKASPTLFNDDGERYVYIAIPRPASAAGSKGEAAEQAANLYAEVVFPSVEIDLYGKNAQGEQLGSDQYYYIFTQGIITAANVGGQPTPRRFRSIVESGSLASDQAMAEGGSDSWWEYNAATDTVKFLKVISEAQFTKLTAEWAKVKQLTLNGHVLDGVAQRNDPQTGMGGTPVDSDKHAVTPAYGEEHWLSRTHDDTAKGNITFENTILVKGETVLKQQTKVGDYEKDIQVGIGARSGILLQPDGCIVAKSLELSGSLTVPVLKYNSIEVLAGTRWDSAGKGRVKTIISADAERHTCQFVLDLNDGEPGELLKDDILRGFWHDLEGKQNAAQNEDDRRGNIARAGFCSIYCRVIKVEDVVERTVGNIVIYIAKDNHYQPQPNDRTLTAGMVTVEARQFAAKEPDGTPTWSPLPQPWTVLSVSGSFSAAHPERQKFFVYTTSYIARFAGVNTWEWGEGTFQGGWGDLTGFVMLAKDENGKIIRKEFHGDGLAAGNVHIYGYIDQFMRFSDKIQILLSRADGTIADGETLRADFMLTDIEGHPVAEGYKLTITRQSGDSETDKNWNAAMATKYPDGIPTALNFVFADLPENGAVFVVAAERNVTTETGSEVYRTSASLVLSPAYAAEHFLGPWQPDKLYERTPRLYPSVTHHGCKWYLDVSSSKGDEPVPFGKVWKMMYGVEDMEIRFYNSAGQRITQAAQYPGYVNLYLEPRLLCGNIDVTAQLEDMDWNWSRYTGNYGEPEDLRDQADKLSDEGWTKTHQQRRILQIGNNDMPASWGTGPVVNFIVSVNYQGLLVDVVVSF